MLRVNICVSMHALVLPMIFILNISLILVYITKNHLYEYSNS